MRKGKEKKGMVCCLTKPGELLLTARIKGRESIREQSMKKKVAAGETERLPTKGTQH